MTNQKTKRKEVDYSARHNVIQRWKMKILKFYRQIEFDDKIYLQFANNFLDGKISDEQIKQIDELMRLSEKNKKEQFEKLKKNRATNKGMLFRKIFS